MGKYLPALRSRMADAECRGDAVALGRLCDAIEVDRPELVQLDAAITELDRLLVEEATGFRLDDLYTKVPEPLPGLVELTYDRFNRPGVRFLEAALYASHLYDPALQAMSLRRIDPDEPGDGMRVPRLAGPGRWCCRRPS